MIISKKVWNERDELIRKLTKEKHSLYLRIEELNLENSRLRYILHKSNLSSIYGSTASHDIDFPNSEKGCEDKLF
mgnify:CR=1 FL=1